MVFCFIVAVVGIAVIAYDKGFDSGYTDGYNDGMIDEEEEGGAK